jgi:hypothetical protein
METTSRRARLAILQAEFDANGGRGVMLAKEIDRLKAELESPMAMGTRWLSEPDHSTLQAMQRVIDNARKVIGPGGEKYRGALAESIQTLDILAEMRVGYER